MVFFIKPRNKEMELSDFGRRYGWTVEYQEHVIAELIYREWESQFWYTYRVIPTRSTIRLSDPNDWMAFTIRNKQFTNYTNTGVVMSPRDWSLVALRGLYVPEHYFSSGK